MPPVYHFSAGTWYDTGLRPLRALRSVPHALGSTYRLWNLEVGFAARAHSLRDSSVELNATAHSPILLSVLSD